MGASDASKTVEIAGQSRNAVSDTLNPQPSETGDGWLGWLLAQSGLQLGPADWNAARAGMATVLRYCIFWIENFVFLLNWCV